VDREKRLRRLVKSKRREAAMKAWDTRRSRKLCSPADVDADSRSVARVIHGDEAKEDEHGLDIKDHPQVAALAAIRDDSAGDA